MGLHQPWKSVRKQQRFLVNVDRLLLNMVIEIVDLPIYSMMDLSSSLCKPLPGRVSQYFTQSSRIFSVLPSFWYVENPHFRWWTDPPLEARHDHAPPAPFDCNPLRWAARRSGVPERATWSVGSVGGLEVSSTSRFGKSYNSWDDYESVGMINPNIWIYIYTPSGYLMIINDG